MDSIDLRNYCRGKEDKERLEHYVQQRAQNGLADCDTWSFDAYLGWIIVKGLRQLARTTHSYPNRFNDCDTWRKTLETLANDFEELITEVQDIVFPVKENFEKDLKDCFLRLSEIFFDLWD